MTNPLIATKLHTPSSRRNLVPRRRLNERLASAADATLLLVSAPAGFGKTTFVVEWLGSLAWLRNMAGAQTDPKGLDLIRSEAADYESITVADVQAAARRWLRPETAWKLKVVPEAAEN
jgi:hypothetical protein